MVYALFFRYEAFFTILEHLKLELSILLFTDWANTKTIIPLSVYVPSEKYSPLRFAAR